MEKSQKRQVAYKVQIGDIISGEYVKEEGEWMPNYVLIGNKKVSRVNLMAVVVSKQDLENTNYQNIMIDDGSGRISIRSFEESSNFDGIRVGDFILLVGRPREYFNEKYIVSEILKKVNDRLWVEVRKLEMEKERDVKKPKKEGEKKADMQDDASPSKTGAIDSVQSLIDLIKEGDLGGGADIQEIIQKSKMSEAEGMITRLLKEGEIFEIKPGKIKVLE
ncbi:hypothetical protein KY358_06085 [Candidatus Woesearchaeota archaeon]|nr:hypothetical protein [Candidatus Woesearchaeota archaeon]